MGPQNRKSLSRAGRMALVCVISLASLCTGSVPMPTAGSIPLCFCLPGHPHRQARRSCTNSCLQLRASVEHEQSGVHRDLLVPTVAFEGNPFLPQTLLSSRWLESDLKENAVGFESLSVKLDSVLLFEAQREKAFLDSCLSALEVGEHVTIDDARTFAEDVRV